MLLPLCLNLPSTGTFAKVEPGNLRLGDASSFGDTRNHGLPYLKAKRATESKQLKSKAGEKLQIKHLLTIPEHLVITEQDEDDKTD